jgi:tRNA uridine 5-carboxymethylaminomethyl modification enzyme
MQMIKLLPGTENARIVHYAYAIEYDYCPPIQLKNNLETKKISGLFLAGQINGTSGYEEAAGQGIIAGINAALKLQGKEPLILTRDQAYIGVMIDDLLTRPIDEPYRMFTSRAEFRLTLRADNADRRLTQIGKFVGLADDLRWQKLENKLKNINILKNQLLTARSNGQSLWDHLRQPNITFDQTMSLATNFDIRNFSEDQIEAVTIDAKYQGYLAQQERLVAGLQNLEKKKIPEDLDYNCIEHLRAEAKEKLSAFRPATLAQALRIGGITPADITVIQIYLKKCCSS